MKTKLTLSLEESTISMAKRLAKKRHRTVSQMFDDYIKTSSLLEEKIAALEQVSGLVDLDLAAEPEEDYKNHQLKKHGW